MRQRVASALAVSVPEVTVDRYRYSPSGLMLQCVGSARRKRYFAKIFLANPYPIPDRFRAPWEAPFASNNRSRPVEDQITAEWEMTIQMRTLAGGDSVPAPLGKSAADQTIVWEEVRGTRMDKTARSFWNLSLGANASAATLSRAAGWLRRLHEASIQGTQTIDVSNALDRLEKERGGRDPALQEYIAMAVETLRASMRMTGKSTFATPLTLTHGDYCLSNLIWERRRNRVSVVDFELSWIRPACHDLFSFISDLHARLLNPMVPRDVISAWEKAFWNGYGPVSAEIPIFVSAFALARIFYQQLPRLLTRRKRLGWLAGVNASFYRAIFERYVITHRLGMPSRPAPPAGGRSGVGQPAKGIASSNSEDRRDALHGL